MASGAYTHTHTHTHKLANESDFKKPGAHRPCIGQRRPGLIMIFIYGTNYVCTDCMYVASLYHRYDCCIITLLLVIQS